jgi:CheY-like chemotaxis protein
MPKKLLLADDSVTIQRVIELTFSSEDVQVLAVGDGEEAIARIPIDKPDIILADIGMPKRSGYEVSAFVKNHPEFAHIPVLLLAGAFEPVDDAKAKEAKCDGVLVKPFEPQHVIARVRELIGGATGSPTQSAVQDIPRPAARLAPPRPVELPRREDRPKVPDDFMDMGEADLEPRAEESQPAVQPLELDDSLDDYFDKLDEAFSSIGGSSSSGAVAPSRTEARPSRPDRPVLERDLESFDEPLMIDVSASHYVEMPVTPEADPFAGLMEVDIEDASAAVPTIDDLLASMPLPAAAAPMTFESPSISFEPPAPAIFEPPPTPVVEVPLPPPVVAPRPVAVAPPVAVAAPVAVAPPPFEPPVVAPAPPPAAPQPVRPPAVVSQAAAPLDSGSSRSIIADAFSALLAAEQGEPGATPVRLGGNGSAPVVTDAMVDDVARRVIEKLALGSSDQMSTIVRQIVSDVAERLVRDEIERIRAKS